MAGGQGSGGLHPPFRGPARKLRDIARSGAPLIRRRLDLQIAISRFVADAVGEPTTTILNGVPDAAAEDPADHTVLVAQRLEPEKCTSVALEAWAESKLASDGWRLEIAGEGAERAGLEAETTRRGLEGVTFLGQQDDMTMLRARAGILLATAPKEPFGLSVAEAMAAGIPVVAADGGAHVETVGAARADLLYRSGDPADCARVLRRLAADVDARRRAGRDLRAFQQQFLGLERHVGALEAAYRSVASNDSSARRPAHHV